MTRLRVAVAVLLGNAVLRHTAAPAEDNGWDYVSYLSGALDPDGAELYEEDEWDEESLSEEDIINYLKKGYSIRVTAKLTEKSVSTVQRVKKDFHL